MSDYGSDHDNIFAAIEFKDTVEQRNIEQLHLFADSKFSETENNQKHRQSVLNQRSKLEPAQRPVVSLLDSPARIPGNPRPRAQFAPIDEASYRSSHPANTAGSSGSTDDDNFLSYVTMRHAGGSSTPDWIDVPSEDCHKYARLFFFDDNYKMLALKEDTLPLYRDEMTDEERDGCTNCDRVGCDGVPCGDVDLEEFSEDVDMSKLFSFM